MATLYSASFDTGRAASRTDFPSGTQRYAGRVVKTLYFRCTCQGRTRMARGLCACAQKRLNSDRDLPMVQAGICVVAALVIFVNLAVDFAYTVLNPRIQMDNRGGRA